MEKKSQYQGQLILPHVWIDLKKQYSTTFESACPQSKLVHREQISYNYYLSSDLPLQDLLGVLGTCIFSRDERALLY